MSDLTEPRSSRAGRPRSLRYVLGRRVAASGEIALVRGELAAAGGEPAARAPRITARDRSVPECIEVPAPAWTVVSAVRDVVRARYLTEYAVIDHGRDLAADGRDRMPAWTILFSDPALEAKLLKRDLINAVDLPLRIAVVERECGHSEIVVRDMRTLLRGDLEHLADACTAVLAAIAAEAAELAVD